MKYFISFEGGEGSGKTTIIEMLAKELINLGYDLVKTREPGGSKIAEEIRTIILNNENTNMDYKTEALLFAASRRQHLKEVIIPALEEEKIVICDRFVDSSLAYQGYARGLGIEEIYEINKYAIGNVFPDLTLYIDVDPNVGLSRAKGRDRKVDRLDLEKLSFHELVREGYFEVAKRYPERVKIINGNRDIKEIYNDIKAEVMKKL